MKQPTCETCKSIDNRNYFANAEAHYALATEAYAVGDVQEAENRCDKIIEIDPKNPNAWMLKGAACAWQFSEQSTKMHEFLSCAQNAFNFSPDLNALNLAAEFIFKEFYSVCLAINQFEMNNIELLNGNCLKYLSNTAEFSANRLALLTSYYTAYGNLSKCASENARPKLLSFENLNLSDLDLRICGQIEDTAISMWYGAVLDFQNQNGGYSNGFSFDKIIEIYAYVSAMLERLIPFDRNINGAEKEFVIRICKELISVKREALSLIGNEIPSFLEYGISADIIKYFNIIKKCDPCYDI